MVDKQLILMKKRISVLLVVIWMTIIFIMSSFNSNDSQHQSSLIVDAVSDLFNINNIYLLSYLIRKLAHFTEFLILGLLVSNVIMIYDKKIYLAIIICVLYAISDEVHQLFITGRSAEIIDVIIDSMGSLLGILIFNIYNKRKLRGK